MTTEQSEKDTGELARSKVPTKDDVLSELIDFFEDEMKRDGLGTCDWFAQGPWDVDAFVAAVTKLKKELALR